MKQLLKVGDEVRFYMLDGKLYGSKRNGWHFGRVIGTHIDDIGINPSGLPCATVRFNAGGHEFDYPLAQFLLEVLQ